MTVSETFLGRLDSGTRTSYSLSKSSFGNLQSCLFQGYSSKAFVNPFSLLYIADYFSSKASLEYVIILQHVLNVLKMKTSFFHMACKERHFGVVYQSNGSRYQWMDSVTQ